MDQPHRARALLAGIYTDKHANTEKDDAGETTEPSSPSAPVTGKPVMHGALLSRICLPRCHSAGAHLTVERKHRFAASCEHLGVVTMRAQADLRRRGDLPSVTIRPITLGGPGS